MPRPAGGNALRNGGTVGEKTATELRHLECMQLVLSGMSMEEVATAVGYADRSAVWRGIQSLLQSYTEPAVVEYRKLHGLQLSRLLQACWEKAILGDLTAIAEARRIIDRLIRLHGADAPQQLTMTVVNVDAIDAQIIELESQLRAAGVDPAALEAG